MKGNMTEQQSAGADLKLPPPRSAAGAAWDDLVEGLSKSWMWSAMAMQDITMRYRGSVLGPFWLTISMAIMIAALGGIYSRLFNMEMHRYLPFLTVGLVIWQFVSQIMIDGCHTFLVVQNIIHQVRLPFSVHAWRSVCRNLIILAHNVVIVPLVIIPFGVSIGWDALLIIPALVILAIDGFWVSILLGMLSARYRDVPPIVTNFVQVVFFITPIFWPPEALGVWAPYLPINPLFAAIDVIRAPLLGDQPMPYSWSVLMITTVLGCVTTFALFVKFRPRIAYWI
jgi:ABC-2 type transport system permease protein/lipopolysaccharide transport system permease protein